MGGVGQLNQDFVRARQKANYDDGLQRGVDKVPRRVIDRDVDVTNPRRDIERAPPRKWARSGCSLSSIG